MAALITPNLQVCSGREQLGDITVVYPANNAFGLKLMKACLSIVFIVVSLGSRTVLAADEPRAAPPQGSLLQGTPEEQAACAPDATKFCQEAIPDSLRVLACLQDHRERLRRECQQVLVSHGQ